MHNQRAKKVVSDRPGLVDFAIRLVNSVLNLPNGQVKFFVKFQKKKNCEINSAHQKHFWGYLKRCLGLMLASACRMASCKNDFLCTLTTKAKRNMHH